MRVGELGPLLRAIIATTKGFLSGISTHIFLHGRCATLQLNLELLNPHRLHMVVGDDGGLAAIKGRGLPWLRLEGCVRVGKACLAFDTERASATLQSWWGMEALGLAKWTLIINCFLHDSWYLAIHERGGDRSHELLALRQSPIPWHCGRGLVQSDRRIYWESILIQFTIELSSWDPY